jgi:hypothetical protein
MVHSTLRGKACSFSVACVVATVPLYLLISTVRPDHNRIKQRSGGMSSATQNSGFLHASPGAEPCNQRFNAAISESVTRRYPPYHTGLPDRLSTLQLCHTWQLIVPSGVL